MATMKPPRPVTRQELAKLQVTDADAFSALRYLRHRDGTPALPELEERGDKKHPGTVGALADLNYVLWAPEPQVREEGDVPADRRWWRQLLSQTVSTAAYQELHAATQLSELKSVLGTVAMGETVFAHVPDETAEELREVAKAQAEADDAAQAAADAQAQADALQAAAEGAQQAGTGGSPSGDAAGEPADGSSQPSMGQKSGQASGTGSSLTDEWAKAQEAAEAAKAKADAAQARADALAQDMLGGEPGSKRAEEKMRELARIGQAALREATRQVSEVSDTIEAWGLDEGELTKEGIPESVALLERMRRNTAFKQFAALLGRIRRIAAKKARSKLAGEGAKVSRRETGRDIRRADPRELIALAHPALRHKALTRWSRGELTLRGQEAKPRLGNGPVIVCEDGSGSMDGAKQMWAKAVTLSLAHYALLQKRAFGWMLFDYGVRTKKSVKAGRLSARELLEIAEARSSGGTNFERPLSEAVEMIKTSGLKKADIVIVTDGDCEVSETWLREFKAAKRQHEFNVVAVICDAGGHVTDKAVQKFADRVERVSSFSAEEAEQKVFKNL